MRMPPLTSIHWLPINMGTDSSENGAKLHLLSDANILRDGHTSLSGHAKIYDCIKELWKRRRELSSCWRHDIVAKVAKSNPKVVCQRGVGHAREISFEKGHTTDYLYLTFTPSFGQREKPATSFE